MNDEEVEVTMVGKKGTEEKRAIVRKRKGVSTKYYFFGLYLTIEGALAWCYGVKKPTTYCSLLCFAFTFHYNSTILGILQLQPFIAINRFSNR